VGFTNSITAERSFIYNAVLITIRTFVDFIWAKALVLQYAEDELL